LRAVRLLPDVVKIGVETETALPSDQEEEQISSEASPDSDKDVPGRPSRSAGKINLAKTQVQLPERQENGTKGSAREAPADPLKDLRNQMESLQKNLSDAEAARTQLMEKAASAEAELAQVKEISAQRERETAATIESAKEQARAEGRTQGHAEGMDSGYKDGLEKARAELSEQYREKFTALTDLLEGVSAKLEAQFADLTALNEPRMLRLWQEMLEKMLQREVVLEPESVLDLLSGILARLSDKNHILIYVSPDDLDLLQESLQGEFEDVLRRVKHLELKSDTSVDKGSCIVETNLGVYDARWRTQFDQLDTEIEKLFQKLGKPPKLKETPRRAGRGGRPETPVPLPEQVWPEQAQPEQESAQAEPKPAAKKKISSKKKAPEKENASKEVSNE
jgi:flagellar assembly protein FliH